MLRAPVKSLNCGGSQPHKVEAGMRTALMRWIRRTLGTVLVASSLMTSDSDAQSAPDPVKARAQEFARAISTGRPSELEQLVRQSFGGNLPNIPMSAHISMLMGYWDQSRGLTFRRLVKSNPNETMAVFQNSLTGGDMGVFLAVEPQAPHRIVALWPLNQLRKPMPEEARSIVPARKLSDRQIARELKAFTERLARADVFSGVVALARDGVPVFAAAYGEANKELHLKNRLDTKFNVASIGKMFTAIAIAQLVQSGEISYDDPLAKFLPDFPDADSAKKIQIKHLLSHTSGLPMGNALPPNSSPKTVDDFLAALYEPARLQFEPGAGYQYSNIGFVVLGKVIEKASGKTYYDYIYSHIMEPAGMRDTVFEVPDPAHRDFAIGYAKNFGMDGKATFESNLRPGRAQAGPHGGARSTIADLLKFDRELRGGKLLPKQDVQILMTAKSELGAPAYGFGFDVNEALGTVGHGGGFNGISNNIEFLTDSGWTAIVLANYTGTGYEVCAPVVVKMRELAKTSASAKAHSTP